MAFQLADVTLFHIAKKGCGDILVPFSPLPLGLCFTCAHVMLGTYVGPFLFYAPMLAGFCGVPMSRFMLGCETVFVPRCSSYRHVSMMLDCIVLSKCCQIFTHKSRSELLCQYITAIASLLKGGSGGSAFFVHS